MTLQRALNETAWRLSIRAPTIVKLEMLMITLSLGFRLDHREDLGTGLYQFGIVQHTSVVQNVLNSHADQHQIIVGSGVVPSQMKQPC